MNKIFIRLQKGREKPLINVVLTIMRVFIFFIIFGLGSVYANSSYSQVKININVQNVSIEDLFKEIQNKSEYIFFYEDNVINKDIRVSLKLNDAMLTEILNASFNNIGLDYTISDRQVVIKTKKTVVNLQSTSVVEQQKIAISGVIKDFGGIPLPGASVLEKGTTNGTQTDFDGNFNFEVSSSNATLVVSYIGFLTQEVALNGKTNITIKLDEDAAKLDEIVVIGYGAQKKENLTGAVSVVSNETIENRPVQNATQALQGQIPGLVISQSNGIPGSESLNMTIRGLNSFGSNNSPLVLIDGVQGNIGDLDPSVIKSVNVLKDASSAAIYGLKAANGVILIQTKAGGKEGMNITYNGSYQMSNPTMLPKMITNSVDFMNLYNQSLINSAGSPSGGYPQNVIDAYGNANNDPLFPNTDWTDLVLRTGAVKKNTIGINGTSGKTSYNLSLSSWNQDGMIENSNYNKYNFFLNFKTEVTDNVEIGGTFTGLTSDRKGPNDDYGSALLQTWWVRPTWGPYTVDGTGHFAGKAFSGSVNDPSGLIFDEGFTRENPMVKLYGQNGTSDEKYNFNGNMFTRIKLLEGLVFNAKGAYKFDYLRSKNQILMQDEYNYRTGEYNRSTREESKIEVGNVFSKVTTFFSTLTYDKNIEEHGFKLMVGYSQEAKKREWTNSTRFGITSRALTELDGAGTANQLTSGSTTESSVRSGFSRFNYSFNDKYLFEANVRTDESSRFADGNRVGVFPSFSAGWRLDQEPFLKDVDFVRQLKLRASWGKLGNDGSNDYPYQSRYAFGDYNAGNFVTTHTSGSHAYPFGAAISPGVVLENFTNADITWETTTISDLGLDFTSKDGLFFANVDYYQKVTSDILRQLQVSIESGAGGPQVNQGEMKNTGWDIVIGHRKRIEDFSYKVSTNFSWYKNELVKYGATEISERTINEEGYALNDFYMWESDGLFNTTEEITNAPEQPLTPYLGGIRLKDQNNDNVVDQNDRVHIDGQHPDLLYGANITAKYKNIEVSTFWQGVAGQKSYRSAHGVEPFNQDGNASKVWLTDSWTSENTNAKLPAVYNQSFSDYGAGKYTNSFWLMNTSYFRMKNITVSYTIPSQFTDRLKLKNAKIYFSGDNILTFSGENLFDIDPEIITSYTYPISKSYTFGINITL
ncbi:TonB-dependent receptor [Lutibacter citreus]|uniref:TonB-dependent receptor n=1 Tax=Lutibacter citreus TaxID=2138210 RepID=UPI000DBE53BE|nr:TonB-dependent receptor [Lutibacter citreus]